MLFNLLWTIIIHGSCSYGWSNNALATFCKSTCLTIFYLMWKGTKGQSIITCPSSSQNAQTVATPLLEEKMTLTLPKWGLGGPPGLPKLQSSILVVKTPRLEAFFMTLEIYWCVDVENDLAWAIWTFASQVRAKRRVGSQISNLTPDQ